MKHVRDIVSFFENADIGFSFSQNNGDTSLPWSKVSIHSAHIEKHGFFVGLQGEKENGGAHVIEAIENGASVVMIEPSYASLVSDVDKKVACIIVEDALHALTRFAQHVRLQYARQCTIIALTGSAGKTTTKTILHALLHAYKGAVCSEGNLNTVQGLSVTLINLDWGAHSFGVFECGISHHGEMALLVDILMPHHALITNVGTAHVGGYANIEQLRKEKISVAKNLGSEGVLWIPDDDQLLYALLQSTRYACSVKTHGFSSPMAHIRALQSWEEKELLGSSLQFSVGNIDVPLLGEANVRNVLAAMQVADYFNCPFEVMKDVLCAMKPLQGRYEVVRTRPLLIDDSYNASSEAVYKSLCWFSMLPHAHKIVVLGGMRELGAQSARLHLKILDYIDTLGIDNIFLIGEEYKDIAHQFPNMMLMSTNDAIIDKLHLLVTEHSAVFFKASRYYHLEKIIKNFL